MQLWYNIMQIKVYPRTNIGLLSMDVDTDSEEESGSSEHFGQKRPPLSVTIKGILERYPDGQVFKVTINYCIIVWGIVKPTNLNIFYVVHRNGRLNRDNYICVYL